MYFNDYIRYKKKERVLYPIFSFVAWFFLTGFNLIVATCITILSSLMLYMLSIFNIRSRNKLLGESKEQLNGSKISYIQIDSYRQYFSKTSHGYIIYYKINNISFKISSPSKFIKFENQDCYLKPIYEDDEFIDFEIYLPKIF